MSVKRAIIVDDEENGINALKTLIEKYAPSIKVVASLTSSEKAIEAIENYRPDILFLDVSMPKMNGFEMLEKINFRDFKLVFTTAHSEYAVKAIKSNAADYLLKPIDIEEFKTCVSKLLVNEGAIQTARPAKTIVELHVRDGVIFIRMNEIIRLEASGSYTTFYLENGVRHIASKNLKECESLLDDKKFFRTHPSHIVNLEKVDRLISSDGLMVKMIDGSLADILRKNKNQFLEQLQKI